jgi:hypothetical protein
MTRGRDMPTASPDVRRRHRPERRPDRARLADGGYVLVWTDSSRTHNGSAMVGQRYDSLGNKVEVKITQFSSGDQ